MRGIFIRYNVSEEETTDECLKKMHAFAYIQRKKTRGDEKLLSSDELRSHAIRYIKSLKENASDYLVEHRTGEIEHFERRYTASLKSREHLEAQLMNLEEIQLLLQSLRALDLSHAFVQNSGKILRELSSYAREAEHPTFETTRIERHFYTELIEHIEVVHARIIRQHNPSTLEMQQNEKQWVSICEQAIEKVEAKIERFSSAKMKHEENLHKLYRLKQQNIEAKERLDFAVYELDQILEALES